MVKKRFTLKKVSAEGRHQWRLTSSSVARLTFAYGIAKAAVLR